MAGQYPSGPITFLTSMVTVYIIISDIIIKLIRSNVYPGWRSLSFKLIYAQIIYDTNKEFQSGQYLYMQMVIAILHYRF